MAENVKDLVVRLSFEHGDTKSQISAIKNELKLLDSEFKLAASGADGMSGSMNKSAAQAANLQQKIQLQSQAVEKYAQVMQEAQNRVDATSKKHTELGQSLTQAKAKQQELNTQIEQSKQKQQALKEQIAAVKAAMTESAAATGTNTIEYQELQTRLNELQSAYKEAQNEQKELTAAQKQADAQVKQLESSYAKADKAVANADKELQKSTTEYNNAQTAQKNMESELNSLNSRIKSHADQLESASKSLKTYSENATKAGESQQKIGSALSKGSAAIVSAGAAAVGAGISWESSFAGVRKTVNGTEEDLKSIEEALLDMGENKSSSYSDLAEIAENAGQLGIATENVVSFTSTMADLAETTNLTADEASSAFAQYANITQMPQSNIENLASVTVELGNNLATTESDIVNFATAIAAAGSQAGMTDQEIFGIAGGLSSLGLEAAAGGTAFSKAISAMQVAVETGSEDLQAYADVCGMTAEQFKQSFANDAAGTFIQFVQGLSSGSESAIVMLDQMGITETRMRDTLLRASNASDLLTDSVNMSNSAWSENNALTNEANVRYNTTASRMTMLGNKVQRTAISFGNSLLPIFEDAMDVVDKVVDKFASLDDSQKKQILTWAAYAAAVGPTISIIGKANSAIGSVTSALSGMFSSIAAGGGGLTGLISSIGTLLGPAGIAALAVGAGLVAYKFVDWASGAKAARDAMEDMNDVAQEMLETTAQTIYDTGTSDFLARFGLSESDFTETTTTVENWLDDLMTVWTDGEKETDEQVQQFAESFANSSDSVRDKISNRESLLSGLGTLDDGTKAQMEADLAQLDAWDQEVAELLKKRQNGTITEDEQNRLNEVIHLRAEMELEYSSGDSGSGYDAIITGMKSEIARANAEGVEVDSSVYGDTLSALAEGRQAYLDSLKEGYDLQYAEIMAIEDEATRQEALNALNEQYNEQRAQGEEEYNAAVKEAATTAWNDTGMKEQIDQIDELATLLSADELDYSAISEWTNNMDEGKMASMLALVEQLKASGMSDSELAELGIDADDLYNKLNQIAEITGNDEYLSGLNTIFGEALPEEVTRVLIGLDCTQAAEDWQAFWQDKQSFNVETTSTITLNDLDEAAISAWEANNKDVEVTGPAAKVSVGLGSDWQSDIRSQYEAGKLKVYDNNGMELEVTPEVLNQITANDVVLTDEDGTIHVIITPEVGSQEAVEQTTENYEDQIGKGTGIGEILFNSASDDVSQIQSSLQQLKEYEAEIEKLKESGKAFNEMNWSLDDLGMLANSSQSLLTEQLQNLSAEDIGDIAAQAANLMAALASGDLDPETAAAYQEQLQGILDLVAASDEYLGEGNMISAGIAEGMKEYGWEGDATTVQSSIQAAIDAAAGIASPATSMYPTGEYIAAGIAEGMKTYDYASAASSVSSSITGAFTTMQTEGDTIGANFGQGLYNGLQSKMQSTLNLAQTYASQITSTFRQAWDIHSPSRVAKGLTGMFGKGLEEGMKNWPTVSERVLDDDVLAARNGMMSTVNNSSDNRNQSVTSNVTIPNVTVRSETDISELSKQIAKQIKRGQYAAGTR